MKLPRRLARTVYWKEQKLRGRGSVRDRLDFLQETQWLSLGEVRALQFEKLHSIVKHAYETVPYYKHVMEERGLRPADIARFEDLVKLPLLTKGLLNTNQLQLVSSEADHRTLQTNFSSGSTGVRSQFVQDLNFRLWMRAHQLRTYGWCENWQVGDPFVLLWGSEIYFSYKVLMDRFENLLSNRREFSTFRLSAELIRAFLRRLVEFKPVLISTYSNAIHLIAREAETSDLRIEGLRCVQATSEPIPPIMRETIKRVFECELFDKYGMRETNIISHESPAHQEMCIQAENVYIEFLRDDGSACDYGERGRVVVTTLNNFSMPLVRYETSDLAAPVAGTCSSGVGLPRMTSVAGRLQDLIVTPKGDHIDAYFFSYLLMRFPEIYWFQVVQRKLDELLIRIFAPAGVSAQTATEIRERIAHHTGATFKIDLEHIPEMPQSSTGKFRLCVSELGAHGPP